MCQLTNESMNYSFKKLTPPNIFIATPKRQLLAQKHDSQIINISQLIFCTAHPFNQPPNLMLYNACQSASHP